MYKKIAFLLITTFLLSSCAAQQQNDTSAIDGGVYRTTDKGITWEQKSRIAGVSGAKSFRATNVSNFTMDPTDPKAIYYGAAASGLFYTYDRGNSWMKAVGLDNNTIRSLSVDQNNHCVVYASVANKIFKTSDCSRNWERIYIDQRGSLTIDAILVSPFDSSVVYLGNSAGDIMKSVDGGEYWQTTYRFKKKVTKLISDPNDSKVLYANVVDKGFYFSGDDGFNWTKTDDMLKDQKLGTAIKDVILFKGKPEIRYFATKNGIIFTEDDGENWTKIDLLLPDKQANINSLVVNPENRDEIYYVTNKIFYKSKDGGANWTPVKINSTRRGWDLLIDPEKPNVIYMAMKAVPQN